MARHFCFRNFHKDLEMLVRHHAGRKDFKPCCYFLVEKKICPICHGKGYIISPLHIHSEKLKPSDRTPYVEKICPTCHGKGEIVL